MKGLGEDMNGGGGGGVQFCLFLLIIKRGCYLIGLWRGNYGKKMKSLNRDSD